MSPNYKCNYNTHQTVGSDFYYYKNMNNNGGGTNNIPMQTVTIPTKENKTRNSSEQKSAKCVQCILPLLCILQVINIVTVSFCFYQYGTLDRDMSAKFSEVEQLRNDLDQDIKNFRNEMAMKISHQEEILREAKVLASNLTQTKKSMYDYEAQSYDDPSYDEGGNDGSYVPSPPNPPPIVPEPEEEDNNPPSRPFVTPPGTLLFPQVPGRNKSHVEGTSNESDSENATKSAETADGDNEDEAKEDLSDTETDSEVSPDYLIETITETVENPDVTTPKPENSSNSSDKVKRQTRNIYNYQKEQNPFQKERSPYEEAEDEYRTTENWNRARKIPKAEIEEKVKMEKTSDRLIHSVLKQNSFISDVYNDVEPSNLTKTIIPNTGESLIQRKETMVAMKQTILPLKTGPISTPDYLNKSHHEFFTPETVAIHLVGDTSKLRINKEKHYDANHRMYHPKGHIKDWKIDSRTIMDEKSNHDQYFKLENGHLKVKQGGLYFVYAQIFYSTKEDTSGFNIYVNDNVVMRCITTGVSTDQMSGVHASAPNSCYTAGLVKIQPDDNLSIKEMQGERFTVFEPTRSFFGLFKLG
ncbi:hypothetical protein WDU94_004307 [Cyamophila willieti]